MSAKIRILIAEDDFVIAQELKISLQSLGYEVLDVVDKGEELLKKVTALLPDLVLLDIQLAGYMDGIDTARQLKEEFQIPFIYLTAQSDHQTIQRATITEPQAYLLKPFQLPELQASVEIAIYKSSRRNEQIAKEENLPSGFFSEDSLFLKVKNRLEKVNLKDILWLEAKDIYSAIKTNKSQYVVSHSLKALEPQLPSDNFVRCHRSYIISLDKIEAIEDNSLIIAGQYIPIGKTYKEALLKRLRII